MATLAEIEAMAREYAETSGKLGDLVAAMNGEIEAIRRKYIWRLKAAAENAAQDKTELQDAVAESPELFVKPRTCIFHGIKVGFQKHKGALVVPDEATTIRLIRKHLPDQAEVLVKITERVLREALNALTAADLRRIGVEIQGDRDEVLIKSTAGEVEKFVNALIEEIMSRTEDDPQMAQMHADRN